MITSENNLTQLSGPNTELGFRVSDSPTDYEKPVIKAASKYLSEDEIRIIKEDFRRSKMDIDTLMKDIYSCNLRRWDIVKDTNYKRALIYVEKKMFPDNKILKPISLSDIRKYPWKKSVSACEPFTSEKAYRTILTEKFRLGIINNTRSSFSNLEDEVFSYTAKVHNDIKNSEIDKVKDLHQDDTLAFARAHLVTKTEPDKIRFVFGCPKTQIITEAMFLWSTVNYLKQRPTHHLLAWGYETLTGGLSKIAYSIRDNTDTGTILAIDWKSFDKRVHFDIIDDIYSIWRKHLNFSEGYFPTYEKPHYDEVERKEIEKFLDKLWLWMTHMIKHGPIRTPDGARYKREFAGVPSGLFATNLLDSWANAIVLCTILFSLNFNEEDISFLKVMGDDSFLHLKIPYWNFQYQQLAEAIEYEARRRFNFIINKKKSIISDRMEGTTFLGFTSRGLMPYKPAVELIASLAHPEYLRD